MPSRLPFTPIPEHHLLIWDLLAAIVWRKESLRLEVVERDGAMIWKAQGHTDDQPKLVGRQYSHYEALKLVVRALGDAEGLFYSYKLIEPAPGPRAAARVPVIVTSYDVKPAVQLLSRLMESLRILRVVHGVEHMEGIPPLTYRLTLSVASNTDYRRLIVPPEDYSGDLTLIAALGTLFRAYANRDGVKFELAVNPPLPAP